MNEEALAKGAQAPDAVTESSSSGKLRLERGQRSSARIEALAQAATRLVPAHGRVIEIGYDHGAILFRALTVRPDITAIGSEILPALGALPIPPEFVGRLTLRTGDGFDALSTTDIEGAVAIIAGMGGRTIAEILTRAPTRTRAFRALVLCASHREADIRPALATFGFASANELLVLDRDRYYEVIVARPRAECALDEYDLDPLTAAWGPRLFALRDPLLRAFLEDTRRRFRAAFAEGLRSYPKSAKHALGEKLASLEAALERLAS